jgi:hypothetical protein
VLEFAETSLDERKRIRERKLEILQIQDRELGLRNIRDLDSEAFPKGVRGTGASTWSIGFLV